tara:strand:+ start:72 stop:770 length:699 start_codon:yes stop_codon:yes gene_type:complete
MNKHILAFRVFDFRDRFPMPFETFTQALEVLQSPKAYMPECGEIICYLKNRQKINIPPSFFIKSKPRFESELEAKAWVLERNKLLVTSPKESLVQALGSSVSDYTKPLAEQIEEALLYIDDEIICVDENKATDDAVTQYLDNKICELFNTTGNYMKHYKKVTQPKVIALTCDKCHKKVTNESDCYKFQEFISINHHCGFTSVFEDNAKLTLDLCQHCFKAMCGEYVVLKWPK